MDVKLRASTLVETLVSMVILSLVSGLAVMVFLQVSDPRASVRDLLKVQQKSNELFEEIQVNGIPDKNFEFKADSYEYLVTYYEKEENLSVIEITVLNAEGKIFYTRKRFFYER